MYIKKQIATIIFTSLMISGCATKQYPQVSKLTAEESDVMDCATVRIETAKMQSLKHQIDETGQFDEKTVLGFLGDLGIGNGMAKNDARKKVEHRLTQLEALKKGKCKV
ncbi:hypothetical protein [Enterobacter cloacae]|uniref:hypothetical protein n=1 Tax=Enterobacter cloacae TaxID=550 RepID=UPI002FF81D0D